jgi:hypothetical protein
VIFQLVKKPHCYSTTAYFKTWGKTLASQWKVLFYEDLTRTKRLPAGTYIFSDVERLSPAEAEVAAQVWEVLSSSGEQLCLLNHPTRSMRRYELLRMLYKRGSNKFNIYRLTELQTPQSFPVFLRGENDHRGNLTPLLHTQEELEAAIRTIDRQGRFRDDKVIVEYCDTSDEHDIFRKYSAFIVGEQIIPTHLFFSQSWLTKVTSIEKSVSEDMLEEERYFVETNPHEHALREIARLAHIEYGRIDYGVLNGEIQVWEINTNPMLPRLNYGEAARKPVLEYSTRQLNLAFESINCDASPTIQIGTSVYRSRSKRVVHSVLARFPYEYNYARKNLKTYPQFWKIIRKLK